MYKVFGCPNSLDNEHDHDKTRENHSCIHCGEEAECKHAPGTSGAHENLFGSCRFCGQSINKNTLKTVEKIK
jgi:hypothetical protein